MISPANDLSVEFPFNDESLKDQFAEAALKSPRDLFKAAKTVFPANMSFALYACNNWGNDPYVIERKRDFLEEFGEYHYLPSKPQVAREIHDISADVKDPELQLKALQLYSNVRGFIEKPGTTINNNQISNKVMIVKSHGGDDEWEVKLAQQQQTLIESSG